MAAAQGAPKSGSEPIHHEDRRFEPERHHSGFGPRAEAPVPQKERMLASATVRELFEMEQRRTGTHSRILIHARQTLTECLVEARRAAEAEDDEALLAIVNRLADAGEQLGAFALAAACRRWVLDESIAGGEPAGASAPRGASPARGARRGGDLRDRARLDELAELVRLTLVAMEEVAAGSR